MKKLLLIASLFSVAGACGMEDTTLLFVGDVFDAQKSSGKDAYIKGLCKKIRTLESQKTALKSELQVIKQQQKDEINWVPRTGKLALSSIMIGSAFCAGVGAIEACKGNGSDLLRKTAPIIVIGAAHLAARPVAHVVSKGMMQAERKATDSIVNTILNHKKLVFASALIAGAAYAHYANK